MSVDRLVRRVSVRLLKMALRLSPPEMEEWGQAMLAELHYVERSGAALRWAIGSAGVVLGRALARSVGRGFGKEVFVRPPRILFSAGVALLPVALLFLAWFSVVTFRFISYNPKVDGTVASSQTIARTPGGRKTVFITTLDVDFDYLGQRRTGAVHLVTSDAREHEAWLRQYALGTRHAMRLERLPLAPGIIGHAQEYTLSPDDPILRRLMPFMLGAFGALLLSVGMLYFGKRRAI